MRFEKAAGGSRCEARRRREAATTWIVYAFANGRLQTVIEPS
jgi:hypothetical protein